MSYDGNVSAEDTYHLRAHVSLSLLLFLPFPAKSRYSLENCLASAYIVIDECLFAITQLYSDMRDRELRLPPPFLSNN